MKPKNYCDHQTLRRFAKEQITWIIQTIRINTATGPDQIRNICLRNLSQKQIDKLAEIINKIIALDRKNEPSSTKWKTTWQKTPSYETHSSDSDQNTARYTQVLTRFHHRANLLWHCQIRLHPNTIPWKIDRKPPKIHKHNKQVDGILANPNQTQQSRSNIILQRTKACDRLNKAIGNPVGTEEPGKIPRDETWPQNDMISQHHLRHN